MISPNSSLNISPRNILAGALFLALGILGYTYLLGAKDFSEFVTLTLIFVLAPPSMLTLGQFDVKTTAKKRALALFFYVLCLISFSTVLHSVAEIRHNSNTEVIHQFGLRMVVFYVLNFVWTLVVPVK